MVSLSNQWELSADAAGSPVRPAGPAKRMSAFDHSSSALWQHPLRAVESPEASSPSPQPATSSLILFVPVYQDWSGEDLHPPASSLCLPPPRPLKTFPGAYLWALLQDNFYYLQITGSITQLPTEASVLLEIDSISRRAAARPRANRHWAGRLYKERPPGIKIVCNSSVKKN